ncbi:MAG: HAD-IA family hydrolase [Syntrophotalea acetylenica]|jgi:HAD superfamily hydrolase (TIGR01509 family)|uniref:phosphoglycolate phosphatase n=1 Tax=Syntrophotalea acetylenica TaxID=29542 RepID=A0A1L3GHA3_SYNAC|nr:HAD-IA family hydrolase [Syntrophotalea acetylenica]APG25324.1 hypothetical protein A7E75_10080 [Syntrophotalea acetylenica]APG43393.1 hypothetical protein A6070_04085 [Syntrophotalea acetylenica]MDD4456475.1 HAD-IA family hydrolase [Syntrophotalea acetylenica]MDY0262663.1 HAD-IA family hydrolase [Syntrophotalea acetylenica]
MVKGLIFDCDGVLFDSLHANVAFYSAALQQLGMPPIAHDDREKIYLCHTVTTPELFEAILGPERLEEALQVSRGIDYSRFIPLMVPEPGILEALSRLSARMPLAVATNRGGSMHDISRHFGLERFFKTILTSKDVARGKPHPDMLLLASDRLGIDPANLLFIGDMDVDQEAARRANIRFVGYRGRFAEAINITSHNQLFDLIEQL